jgi:MFS family permease
MTQRATHHYYHVLRLRELRRLYWAHTVKELAGGMVSIFVPIYLYRLHYSIPAIMGYFLIGSLFWGVTQAPLLRLASRIGFNRSMGVSMFVEGVQILMFATISHFHWPLWLIACVWGTSLSLYWPQFRACFTRSLLHRQIAPAAGLSSALLMLALGIAPAIGGAIASWLGIGVLYVVSVLCFVAAALPLFVGPEIIVREEFSFRQVPWREAWRDLVANSGSEVDGSIASSAWPLFIFLIIPSYVGVGVLSSVGVIASILIALYVGRRPMRGMTGYLKNGANVVALTDAIRLVAQSIGQVAGINFFYGLGQALMVTPFYSRYYQNAEHEPLLPYVYAMQMVCVLGDSLLFGLLLLLSLVAPTRVVLIVGLLIAIPAGYCIRLIRAPRGAPAASSLN